MSTIITITVLFLMAPSCGPAAVLRALSLVPHLFTKPATAGKTVIERGVCSAASHRDYSPSKSTQTNRLWLLSTASVAQRLHSRQGQTRNLRHRQETPRKSKGREGCKDTGTPRLGQHQNLPVQYLLLSRAEPKSFTETHFKPTKLWQ